MKTKLWYRLGEQKEKYPVIIYYILESLLIVLEMIKGFLRFLSGLFIACIVFLMIGLVIAYFIVKPTADECFKYSKDIVYTTNVDTFRLYNEIDYIEYERIPESLVNGLVLTKDKNFWKNNGLDIKGMFYTFVAILKDKEIESIYTITQQLVKEVYLDNKVGVENKAKEMLIAMKLNKKFSKESIMEFYCNCMNYGNNIYGLDNASKTYFGKNINELSLKEQTYICAIIGSSHNYNPWRNPKKVEIRSKEILRLLLENDYITHEEYDNALNETVRIRKS